MTDFLEVLDESSGNPTGELISSYRVEIITPDGKPNRFWVLLRNGARYLVSNRTRSSISSILLTGNLPEMTEEEFKRWRR